MIERRDPEREGWRQGVRGGRYLDLRQRHVTYRYNGVATFVALSADQFLIFCIFNSCRLVF